MTGESSGPVECLPWVLAACMTSGVLGVGVASGVPSPGTASGRARGFWGPGYLSLGFQAQERPLARQVASAGVVGPDMEEVLLGKVRMLAGSWARPCFGFSVLLCSPVEPGASARVLRWDMEMRVGRDVEESWKGFEEALDVFQQSLTWGSVYSVASDRTVGFYRSCELGSGNCF